MSDFLQTVNEGAQKALKVLRRIDNEKKLSEFAREKFSESGINPNSSKAEDMLDELYDIAYGEEDIIDKEGKVKKVKKAESQTRIKAIKAFAEMVGGGLNEKQTNIQNNISGNFFLDMLSSK